VKEADVLAKAITIGFWEKKGRNQALGAFLAATLIVALYEIAGNLVLSFYMLGDASTMQSINWSEYSKHIISRYRTPILVATMVFEFVFFGAGTWFIYKKWHGVDFQTRFRFSLPKLSSLPAAVLGAAGLFPLAILAGEIFSRAFPFIREIEERSESLLQASGSASWILLISSICITPALFEEFLFRGYLQGTSSLRLKKPLSWILPGAFFALIHQNYFGLGALLIIGIYLAFVFETSLSIYPGMLVHFLYNGSVLLLSNAEVIPSWLYGESGFINLWVVAAGLPLAALGIVGLILPRQKVTSKS
jgi:membrane protease YdiL (CAAX protease family)